MKAFITIVSVLIAVGSCYLAFRYHQNAELAQGSLNEERYNKMLAEESLLKANSKISSLESGISRMEKKLSANDALLVQTKAINKDLRARLDKISEFKEKLEAKIQELELISTN